MLCSDIIISAAAPPQEKIGMKELGNSLMIGFLEADTVNISVPDPYSRGTECVKKRDGMKKIEDRTNINERRNNAISIRPI